MPELTTLLHAGAVSGALYAGSAATATLVALLAPSQAHRRDARKVLAILLRQPHRRTERRDCPKPKT